MAGIRTNSIQYTLYNINNLYQAVVFNVKNSVVKLIGETLVCKGKMVRLQIKGTLFDMCKLFIPLCYSIHCMYIHRICFGGFCSMNVFLFPKIVYLQN